MQNTVSNSYSELEIVKSNDIPELVEQCLETNVNLLIYGEPGCGKSAIIESMADKYFVVQLGAASLCEEMINGIPVHDSKTNTINYDKPEWLRKIQANHESDKEKPQILFIDELTLARPEVANSLQLLCSARCVPTHPNDKLPDNVVIVSATNTAEDTSEGFELSRPLKTRFMSVRMTNSPSDYKEYVMSVADKYMSDIKAFLGDERFARFVSDSIADFSEHWCDNTKFYGTNPRTIMNYFKVCNYVAKKSGALSPMQASVIARRTTGHKLATFNWLSDEQTQQATAKEKIVRKDLYPTKSDIEAMTLDELENAITTIERSPKVATKRAIETLCRLSERATQLRKENKENN